MNFLEGTRFRQAKHDRQQSPYRHLLKPKAGGIAFALNAMDGTIGKLIDVTIVYHPHRSGFWDLMSGRINKVSVHARELDIPEEFLHGDYQDDPRWRMDFQAWVRDLWEHKDRQIETLLDEQRTGVQANA